MARKRDKRGERQIARERVARLVALAEQAVAAQRPERAHRYAELAWRVKTTYQLRGCAIDGRRCRSCGAFLSGATSRVRLRDGVRVTTCLACGAVRRRPLALRRPAQPPDAPGAAHDDR
ncbi:MAG TPA: ribonuclease P [Candidatus Thermoplasmatota archaeon]|nr:ribonuclease P [Candidatus Thermoplasmatota archaeon]